MPAELLQSVVQYLHRIIDVGPGAASDAELLERFASNRDESAFALLVCRHGPLVLGVCRRVLRHEHDSEDVFQATFLTLARKANSINKKDTLASWLYKVAFRIACRARGKVPMLTNQTATLQGQSAADPDADVIWRDLRGALDQEVAQLPEAYSRPIILCYLEGKTHEEAAALLGWPKGTVASRLARGRDRLRQRLVKRGWTLSAGVLATVLTEKAVSAAIPGELVRSTVQAALAYVAGASATVISAKAVVLAEGVMQMMWFSKVKTAFVMMLALIVTGSGVGWAMHQALAGGGPEQAVQKPKVEPPGDSKADIAAMRAEIAKLRMELDAAIKEIKSLKEARPAAAAAEQLYKGKPVRYWLDQFNDADLKFRAEAVDALGVLARKNKDLIPVLVSAMRDPQTTAVGAKGQTLPGARAVKALGNLGPDVLPTLLDILNSDKNLVFRRRAAQAIGHMGPSARAAVPALVTAMKSDDIGLCGASLSALTSVGPDAKAAIPALMEVLDGALKDSDKYIKDGDNGGSSSLRTSRFGLSPSHINVLVIDALSAIDPEVELLFPSNRFGKGNGAADPLMRNHVDLRKTQREEVALAWRNALETLKKRYAK